MGKKSRLKKERRKNKGKVKAVNKQQLPAKLLLVYLAVLIFAGILVYWQSLNNDFVNLDDNEHVYENPHIKGLSWTNIKSMFSGARMGNWIPLTQLSFAFDHEFWGLNAFGFHLSNLIIHIVNTLLVFWLIWLLCGNMAISLIMGLLFSVSPLHVESVAWITERKDVLYGLFYLLALIFWQKWRKGGKPGFYILTLGAFILSLLAKSMAVTLPLILILYDVYYKEKPVKKVIIDKLPFFLLAALTAFITWKATYSETQTYAELNLFERLLVANYAFWFYPFKLLLPIKLSAIYPYPENINQALPVYYYLLPLLTIGLAGFLAKQKGKIKSIMFWFWFYLFTILPVLQLVPLAGSSLTCDRFTYLPSLGIFMILFLLVWRIFKPIEINKLKWEGNLDKRVVVIFLLLSTGWGIMSWQRSLVWKDGITLHSDVISKYPQIELPWINRGKAYSQRGEHGKAISDFTRAIEVSPQSADAYNNRGNEYGDLQQFEKGISDLDKAVELRPDFAEAYSNRAHLYMEKGDMQSAELDFDKALKLNPQYAGGWFNRGNLYRQTGNFSQAISDYDQAIKLQPGMAVAYNNRGTSYSQMGKFTEAIDDFNLALLYEPDNISFLNNRANAYNGVGSNEKALVDLNKAISINPGYHKAYYSRAVVYYSLKNKEKAIENINKVKALGGNVSAAFEQAVNNLEN